MVNAAFWRSRRVLVTGHTGFKGGWLSFWLKQLGADLVGYALAPSTNPNLFEAAGIEAGMTSVIADIRDHARLSAALAQARPEIVFHLAAQPLVRRSYADPLETYATNVMGTAHLLEAVRQTAGVKAVVVVTSDKCYDNRERARGYSEDEPLGGRDPYSSSKACAELVTGAYRKSYFDPQEHSRHGVALASARAGNVIGGGDWAEDRLIPDVVRAFAAGKQVSLRNPEAVRPWQHVLEPSCGYLMLAEKLVTSGPRFAEAWNFGPEETDARTVAWVVDRVAQAWGRSGAWRRDEARHPHEAAILKLDSSKAKARLGWRPRWSLERALAAMTDWYRAHLASDDVVAIMRRQIDQYQGA